MTEWIEGLIGLTLSVGALAVLYIYDKENKYEFLRKACALLILSIIVLAPLSNENGILGYGILGTFSFVTRLIFSEQVFLLMLAWGIAYLIDKEMKKTKATDLHEVNLYEIDKKRKKYRVYTNALRVVSCLIVIISWLVNSSVIEIFCAIAILPFILCDKLDSSLDSPRGIGTFLFLFIGFLFYLVVKMFDELNRHIDQK
jgi:predicted membrane-bound mannosyltransferase